MDFPFNTIKLSEKYYSNVLWPVPMAARSMARTVFDLSNTGTVGSNSARGMGSVRIFLCCVVLCAGGGLASG